MNKWPKVGIIVLNWNGWQDTIECVESLQRLTYPNYQIIVVDNGSTDESVARIREAFPDLTLIEIKENLGYAGGNNLGIEYALDQGAEYVLILNNDVTVEPDTLTVMIEVAKEANAHIVGALVKDSTGRKVLFARSAFPNMLLFSEHQQRALSQKWWLSDRVDGSAVLLCRDLLLERKQCCGYFLDESLFLYCEEIELALWCRKNSKRTVITGEAIVYHKLSKSTGGKGKPIQFYYLTRNRLLVGCRYLRGISKLLFVIVYTWLRVIRAIMYVGRGKVEIAYAIFQGLVDGLKGEKGQKRD
ncbi:MAG: glycosyltransferase family 2 protein [Candidatus Bathyarchaeia archaeon]